MLSRVTETNVLYSAQWNLVPSPTRFSTTLQAENIVSDCIPDGNHLQLLGEPNGPQHKAFSYATRSESNKHAAVVVFSFSFFLSLFLSFFLLSLVLLLLVSLRESWVTEGN